MCEIGTSKKYRLHKKCYHQWMCEIGTSKCIKSVGMCEIGTSKKYVA